VVILQDVDKCTWHVQSVCDRLVSSLKPIGLGKDTTSEADQIKSGPNLLIPWLAAPFTVPVPL